MKKFIVLFFCLMLTSVAAQSDNSNVFDSAEPEVSENSVQHKGDPNPGDPVPIDNYIPFLSIVAVGVILYSATKRKTMKIE